MNAPLDIVITMAGLGSRFRKMGYTVPKYMIEARGRTLFEWSLISLSGFRAQADRYIFVAMKDDSCDAEAFIRAQCQKLGIERYTIVMLDYLTDGQATTVMQAAPYWDPAHALLIYNIDTYVEAGEMRAEALRGDGFIPCFHAEGDHWSFVRLDDAGRVVEIKEKVRISDNCTLGAYYFRSCGLYSRLYRDYYGQGQARAAGEKYVAPMYDYLLSTGGEIYICDIPAEKVHVLGTPEELQAFLREAD